MKKAVLLMMFAVAQVYAQSPQHVARENVIANYDSVKLFYKQDSINVTPSKLGWLNFSVYHNTTGVVLKLALCKTWADTAASEIIQILPGEWFNYSKHNPLVRWVALSGSDTIPAFSSSVLTGLRFNSY